MALTRQLIDVGDFKDFTEHGNGVLLFTSKSCKSALIMSATFEKLAKEYKHFLKFGKIDIENFNDIISHMKVGAVPEFLIYKNGQVDCRQHITRIDELESFVAKYYQREKNRNELDEY